MTFQSFLDEFHPFRVVAGSADVDQFQVAGNTLARRRDGQAERAVSVGEVGQQGRMVGGCRVADDVGQTSCPQTALRFSPAVRQSSRSLKYCTEARRLCVPPMRCLTWDARKYSNSS